MKLVPKLTLAVVSLTVIVLVVIGGAIQTTSEATLDKMVNQQLLGNVGLVENVVKDQQAQHQATVEFAARNGTIADSLALLSSKGVAQTLNHIPQIYPHVRYVLLSDLDGLIFAATSRSNDADKLANESLIRVDLSEYSAIWALMRSSVAVSDPSEDALLPLFGIQSKHLTQWLASPVKKDGKTVGWIIVAVDWTAAYREILIQALDRISLAGAPIQSIGIASTDTGEELIVVGNNDVVKGAALSDVRAISFAKDSFRLALNFDKQRVYEPLEYGKSFIFVSVGFSVIVLSILLFALLYYLLSRPLKQIEQQVAGFYDGDFSHRIESINSDEIGSIVASINHLAKHLQMTTTSMSRLNSEAVVKQQALAEGAKLSQQLSAVLDTAADGIITIDEQGAIHSFNQAAQRMFGYSEEEIVGQNVNLLMPSAVAMRHKHYVDSYLATGNGKIIGHRLPSGRAGRELIGKRRNGDEFPIVLAIAKVQTDSGLLFSGVIRDDTEVKAAERELIAAKEQAIAAAKAKSEFLAVMSHEIRTPMNGVIGMLELLLDTKLSKPQYHQAYLAHSSALSLLDIINDILDFSKIEADKLVLEAHHFDLRRMLGDLVESMAVNFNKPEIELILNIIGVQESMVKGDVTRIRQIFVNLLSNALKFTDRGEVVVEVKLIEFSEKYWQLVARVEDSGIGIPTDKIPTLFDNFSQVDASTTRKYGGTGLGLAIAKKLCEKMQGQILATSQLGKGSEFYFDLLVEKSDQSARVLPAVDISQLKILVVDDNWVNREVLRGQLEHWGASVVEAESYDAATKQCETRLKQQLPMFDIAFIDMQMPEKDGAQLGEFLHNDARFSSIKLVMMTSMDAIGDPDKFSALGFSGYFAKPATTSDLFDALNLMSDQSYNQEPSLITHSYISSLSPSKAPILEPLKSGLHILVVEDSRVNQIVINGILEKQNVNVTIAEHGKQAIALLEGGEEFDAVFMDCQMPEMDGFETTRQIRAGKAGEASKEIAIIAMTANALSGDRERCIASGMNDYIAKPINKQGVIEKLVQWTS